jgi:hypothetical protein
MGRRIRPGGYPHGERGERRHGLPHKRSELLGQGGLRGGRPGGRRASGREPDVSEGACEQDRASPLDASPVLYPACRSITRGIGARRRTTRTTGRHWRTFGAPHPTRRRVAPWADWRSSAAYGNGSDPTPAAASTPPVRFSEVIPGTTGKRSAVRPSPLRRLRPAARSGAGAGRGGAGGSFAWELPNPPKAETARTAERCMLFQARGLIATRSASGLVAAKSKASSHLSSG